jgi:hypothetical protein
MIEDYNKFLDEALISYESKTNQIHQLYAFKKVSNKFKSTSFENIACHKKLIKNGYLELMPSQLYIVTIEGREFIKNGGYTQKRKNDIVQINNQRLINFALIFGGVAAGCYYSFELLKMVCLLFHA